MSKNIVIILFLTSLVSCTRTIYKVSPPVEQIRVSPATTVVTEPPVVVREPVVINRHGRVVERVNIK